MIRATIFAILLAAGAASAHADVAGPAPTIAFKADAASSSGWIDFTPYKALGIYLPVKINGHDAMAWLWGGPTSIDKGFAASIGLKPDGGAAGLDVQAGTMDWRSAAASPDDLQAQAYAPIIGQPLSFRLGEELFRKVVVDLDFAHHRVAFRDPNSVRIPAGAVEMPLTEQDGEWVVPLSVDGAAPALFELELGNMNGPLLVTPVYAEAHRLLEGRSTSQRLSGAFVETVVSADHLSFAGVDFPRAPIAVIPESQLPPPSITGGVGLPLLSRFRLIIDYPHHRLYAIPNADAAKAPIAKDRIGLVLGKKNSNFVAAFVAPDGPASAAGFRKGDEIALIDGKPFAAWSRLAITEFTLADAGTRHSFTLLDGTVRQVEATDFF
jgi:hypothetical protein